MSIKPIQQRAAGGVVAGFANVAFTVAQAIIQVPLLLYFWSSETYGLWNILLATLALVTALDAGHHAYLGNRFGLNWLASRGELARELASGVWAGLVLGVVEVGIGIALLAGGGSGAGAAALYLIYWAVFGTCGGILVRLYPPAGLYARGQWLGIVSRLLAFLALVGVAAAGGSIREALIGQVVVGTVFNLYLFSDIRRQIPSLYPWWKGGDWAVAWHNFRASLALTGAGVLEQLSISGVVLIIGRALSPAAVAIFTTMRTVTNVGTQINLALVSPIHPDFARYHVTREGDRIGSVFSVAWLVGNTLVAAGLIVGVLVVEPLYAIWTRGQLPFASGVFSLLAVAIVLRQWSSPLHAYLTSINHLNGLTAIMAARGVAAAGGTLLLVRPLGLAGAGWAVLGGEVAAAALGWTFSRTALRGVGGEAPRTAASMAMAQTLVAGLVLWVFAAESRWLAACSAAGVAVVCYLCLRQWQELPVEIQERLMSLLPFVRSPAASRSSAT